MRSYDVRLALLFLLCLTFLACGGGGGGGGGGGSVSVSVTPGTATVGRNGQVTFVATVSGSSNPDVTWQATAGTITPTGTGTALFTAPDAVTTVTVTATSSADPSKSDSSTVNVLDGVATVTGRILRQGVTVGLPNVIVQFKNAGGTVLATATTNAFGYFSAAVPTTAVEFHIQNTSALNGYYKQYNYDGDRYTILDPGCNAPLPALTANTNSPLGSNITIPLASGPPPPPPSGCS
jgi:hypothetical protein